MKKAKNNEMNIVFLLDRSGSMQGMENDTIGGYNSYIASQKGNNVYVTTILFDDQYELLNKHTPIANVKKMTRKEYFVRGSTALLDALGRAISDMDELKKEKVMFVITTDGYENASVKYTKEEIKKLINMHDNYEFIYIGADIDSYAEGSSLGIKRKNIANYDKSRAGIGKLYSAISKLSTMYCEEASVDESWKQDLNK